MAAFTDFNPTLSLKAHSLEKQEDWLLTNSRHAIRPLAPEESPWRDVFELSSEEERDNPRSVSVEVSLSLLLGIREITTELCSFPLFRRMQFLQIKSLYLKVFILSNCVHFSILQKTGARIKIYSHCCPHSTDRLISICGKPTTCIECIRELIATIKTVSFIYLTAS